MEEVYGGEGQMLECFETWIDKWRTVVGALVRMEVPLILYTISLRKKQIKTVIELVVFRNNPFFFGRRKSVFLESS